MVKVIETRFVSTTNINHADRWVGQIVIRWIAALDGNAMQMCQQATRQEIVFVGTARMGHYQLNGHEVLSQVE